MAYRNVLMAALLSSMAAIPGTSLAENIPEGYIRVATAHGVPPEALYAVSLTETAMAPRDIAAVMKSGALPPVTRPWPWTINVAGKGYRYASRLEAWQALQVFMKRYPLKRIDVGLAQVNLGWNGHLFASTWAAFDPYTNLNAAASLLRDCWKRKPGSWLDAAGCYHHPAGGRPAARYRAIVSRHLTRLSRSPAFPETAQKTVAVAALTPASGFIWTEPGR
jgi:hypothetical protein